MKKYARIEDGRVVEILDLPDDVSIKDAFHPDIAKNIKPCDLTVAEGFEWTGKKFQPPQQPAVSPDELYSYAAWKRYSLETSGLEISGVKFDTSRESQSMVTNAYNFLNISGHASTKFKAASGWVEVSKDDLLAAALSIGEYVQFCFNAEAEVHDLISSGSISSFFGVDEKFNQLMGDK